MSLFSPGVFIPNVSQCLWERPNPSPGCPRALRDFEGMPLTGELQALENPSQPSPLLFREKLRMREHATIIPQSWDPGQWGLPEGKCLRPVDLLFSCSFSPMGLLWPWLEFWRQNPGDRHIPLGQIFFAPRQCQENARKGRIVNCFPFALSHFLLTFSLSFSPNSRSRPSPTLSLIKVLPSTLWVSSLSSLFGFPALVLASFDLGGRSGIYWLVQHLGGLWWLLFIQHSPLWEAQVLLTHLQMRKSRLAGSSDQPKGQRTSMLKPYHFRLGQSSLTFHLQRSWAPPS